MKTYLVTGGAGFIGSNFVHHVLARYGDARVVNVDALTYAGNLENLASLEGDPRHVFARADIRDREAMDAAFRTYQPDFVVNFAAESHVDRSIENPGAFADTNVMGTLTLLDAARAAWEQPDGTYASGLRFLQVSTDEVYGSLPLDQPDLLFREDTPVQPHSPYSASKAAADMFVLAYGTTYGLPVNITRCSNNYGPYQFPEKLIPLMIHHALQHKALPLYGDGLNVRDWLYVEDHCRALCAVLAHGVPGQVYNVGGHNERSNAFIVQAIIEQVRAATGDSAICDALVAHVEDRKGHDRRYGIDPSKIAADLGWQPDTPFEEGLAKTIRWYLENPEWVDHATSGAYQDYCRALYGDL